MDDLDKALVSLFKLAVVLTLLAIVLGLVVRIFIAVAFG